MNNARFAFQAIHPNGSSLSLTITAPNAPVAMARGVDRCHEAFGAGVTVYCTVAAIDGPPTRNGKGTFRLVAE